MFFTAVNAQHTLKYKMGGLWSKTDDVYTSSGLWVHDETGICAHMSTYSFAVLVVIGLAFSCLGLLDSRFAMITVDW